MKFDVTAPSSREKDAPQASSSTRHFTLNGIDKDWTEHDFYRYLGKVSHDTVCRGPVWNRFEVFKQCTQSFNNVTENQAYSSIRSRVS
jgi:hypothetical protein